VNRIGSGRRDAREQRGVEDAVQDRAGGPARGVRQVGVGHEEEVVGAVPVVGPAAASFEPAHRDPRDHDAAQRIDPEVQAVELFTDLDGEAAGLGAPVPEQLPVAATGDPHARAVRRDEEVVDRIRLGELQFRGARAGTLHGHQLSRVSPGGRP
jgi:hypothetical protein